MSAQQRVPALAGLPGGAPGAPRAQAQTKAQAQAQAADPSRLDDFVFLSRVGKGSFGSAFKVRRKADGREYCIKQIALQGISARQQQAAVNEVRVLAFLDSAHVVHYYDAFFAGDQLNIVMEYAAGGSLYAYLRRRNGVRLAERTVWRFFFEMATGLYHMHQRRILHRDLKSLNVLIGAGQRLMIGDLGCAKIVEHHGQSVMLTSRVGTPYYLSPEMCTRRPYNDRSDVWALGVIVYECCMLRHPFDGRRTPELVRQIVSGRYTPVGPEYSTDLARLIRRLLTADPEKRPDIGSVLYSGVCQRKAHEIGFELPPPMQTVPPQISAAPMSPRALKRPESAPLRRRYPEGGKGGGGAAGAKKREKGRRKREEKENKREQADEAEAAVAVIAAPEQQQQEQKPLVRVAERASAAEDSNGFLFVPTKRPQSAPALRRPPSARTPSKSPGAWAPAAVAVASPLPVASTPSKLVEDPKDPEEPKEDPNKAVKEAAKLIEEPTKNDPKDHPMDDAAPAADPDPGPARALWQPASNSPGSPKRPMSALGPRTETPPASTGVRQRPMSAMPARRSRLGVAEMRGETAAPGSAPGARRSRGRIGVVMPQGLRGPEAWRGAEMTRAVEQWRREQQMRASQQVQRPGGRMRVWREVEEANQREHEIQEVLELPSLGEESL